MNGHLFHADVFLPERLKRPLFEGRLKYGPHAIAESKKDRYGTVPLPEFFEASDSRCIEVEYDLDAGRVTKQVWRQRLDDNRDLVLVIGLGGHVRTVWVNLHSDKHHTLDTSKYVKGLT